MSTRPHSLFLEDLIFNTPASEVNLGGSTPVFPFGVGFFNDMPISLTPSGVLPEKQHLKEAIAKLMGATADQLVFSMGSSMALFQTLAALTKAGDTILIEDPQYEPFLTQSKFLGLKVRLFKRTNDPDKDLKEIKKKKRGVKVLLLTNPHAPVGKKYSKEFLDELAELFPFLIADEVFEPLFSDDGRLSSWREDLPDNVLTIHSFSKAVGLSSIRLGVTRSRDPELAHQIELQGNLFHIDLPTPSLLYAIEVVKKWDAIISAIESKIAPARRNAQAFAQVHPKALSHDFRHGFFGMLKAPAKLKTGERLSREMLKHGYYVRPGDLFRMPQWVRFHLFMTPEQNEKFWRILENLM